MVFVAVIDGVSNPQEITVVVILPHMSPLQLVRLDNAVFLQ
jgi:hypothetical protein